MTDKRRLPSTIFLLVLSIFWLHCCSVFVSSAVAVPIGQRQVRKLTTITRSGTVQSGSSPYSRTMYMLNPHALLFDITDVYGINATVSCTSSNTTLSGDNNCRVKYLSQQQFNELAQMSSMNGLDSVDSLYESPRFGSENEVVLPSFSTSNDSTSFRDAFTEFLVVVFLDNDVSSSFTYNVTAQLTCGHVVREIDLSKETTTTIIVVAVVVPLGTLLLLILFVSVVACILYRRHKAKNQSDGTLTTQSLELHEIKDPQ